MLWFIVVMKKKKLAELSLVTPLSRAVSLTMKFQLYGDQRSSPISPFSVPSSAHLLALVDENGSLVIYDTNRYGEKALLKGTGFRFSVAY